MANLIALYPKDFPKLQVELLVGEKDSPSSLTILTPKGKLCLMIDGNERASFIFSKLAYRITNGSLVFKESLNHNAWGGFEFSTENFKVIMEWLFDKFDVSEVRLQRCDRLNRLVINALTTYKCRCYKVTNNIHRRMGYPSENGVSKEDRRKWIKFFKEQKKLGVSPMFVANNIICPSILRYDEFYFYTTLFGEVSVVLRSVDHFINCISGVICMNTLSTDELLVVFRFLPQADTTRFQRLSKKISAFFASYPKDIPKLQLELIVGEHYSPSSLTILTPKGKLCLKIDDKDMASFMSNKVAFRITNECSGFKEGDVHSDLEVYEFPKQKFNLIAVWLFKKFNVSKVRLHSCDRFNMLVIKALATYMCPCFKVIINGWSSNQGVSDADRRIWTHFYKKQNNLGVNPKLYANNIITTRILRNYCDHFYFYISLFGEVSVMLNTVDDFVTCIIGVIKNWSSNLSDSESFSLRFHMTDAVRPYNAGRNVHEILKSFDVGICNSAEKEFNALLANPLFHKFPQFWDFEHESSPTIMRMYFIVKEDTMLITQEFLTG